MRRFWYVGPLVALALLGLVASTRLNSGATAQEGTPTAATGHPLVGTWLLNLGEDGGRLFTFGADGTVLFTDIVGKHSHGTWEATGERTARFTTFSLTTSQDAADEGNVLFAGYFLLIGEVEVGAKGNVWTGTISVVELDRANVVQSASGPSTVSATRVPLLPTAELQPGTPVTGIPVAATPAS